MMTSLASHKQILDNEIFRPRYKKSTPKCITYYISQLKKHKFYTKIMTLFFKLSLSAKMISKDILILSNLFLLCLKANTIIYEFCNSKFISVIYCIKIRNKVIAYYLTTMTQVLIFFLLCA